MKSRVVLRKKMGPATEEGRRRISEAGYKTGLYSNAVIADRKKCRELIQDTQQLLSSLPVNSYRHANNG